MKKRITTWLQSLVADRGLLSVLSLFLVGCVAVLIYLAVSIHASELQIVVHYTSFGTTNFYRDKWYYLLNFALFIVIMAVVHVVLTQRILIQKGRQLALAYAWLGVVMVFLTGATIYQVVRIASLT